MASQPIRDGRFEEPAVGKTGMNKSLIPHLRKVLGDLPTIRSHVDQRVGGRRVRPSGQCYRSQETTHDGVADGGLPNISGANFG